MSNQTKLERANATGFHAEQAKSSKAATSMNRRKLKQAGLFTLFVGPAFLAFAIIVLVPFFTGMYYAFTDWNGVTGNIKWVGFDNFKYLFTQDKEFQTSFWLTLRYTVVAIVLTNVVGFALALLVTRMLKTRNILRTVFFLPNLIGGLLLGFIWQFIFIKGFASLGQITGLSLFKLSWLGDEKTAFWGIVIVSVWQGAGYLMLIYTAALQNVPQELIEAATIDGANRWQVLRHITLPMVAPAVTICLFLTISSSFKIFDVNLSLTNGGPFKSTEMLALNIYTEAFVNNRYGLGEAKALVFFIVVALITVIQVTYTKRKEIES